MQPTTGRPLEESDHDLTVNTGSLVVFVLDAGGALPIPGALVKIYNAGEIMASRLPELISGESGKPRCFIFPHLRCPLANYPTAAWDLPRCTTL